MRTHTHTHAGHNYATYVPVRAAVAFGCLYAHVCSNIAPL